MEFSALKKMTKKKATATKTVANVDTHQKQQQCINNVISLKMTHALNEMKWNE